MPQLELLELVASCGELWRVVAGCGELWVSYGKHESTGTRATDWAGECWAKDGAESRD